jgi:hypothetical protein
VFAVVGLLITVGAFEHLVERSAAFFAAGLSLLAATLCLFAAVLGSPVRPLITQPGLWAVARVGLRNAANRPGRSVLSAAVIALATFILVSIDTFRQPSVSATDRHSGVGGYVLQVDLLTPLAYDPNTPKGRDVLGIKDPQVSVEAFRMRPGDDASCLNLYEPRNPQILGVSDAFVKNGRFRFEESLAANDAERANPWLILERDFGGDVVPAITDSNSLTYVLHRKLGEDIVIDSGGRQVRFRIVAALADSIFQSELVISDKIFTALFPDQQGYRRLLVDAPASRAPELVTSIERAAADFGADAISTSDRLAEFHRVENTYLSTFQMLGGFGLLLGTLGLAAVLLRNVLERQRELALMAAVGYRRAHLVAIVLAENLVVLACGVGIGIVCALVAVAPVMSDRGGRLPAGAAAWLLVFAVLATGTISSLIATAAALGTPLLQALRSE